MNDFTTETIVIAFIGALGFFIAVSTGAPL